MILAETHRNDKPKWESLGDASSSLSSIAGLFMFPPQKLRHHDRGRIAPRAGATGTTGSGGAGGSTFIGPVCAHNAGINQLAIRIATTARTGRNSFVFMALLSTNQTREVEPFSGP